MKKRRLHFRLSRSKVTVDSPLIDCRLLNISPSGLAIETSVGLRLGVAYPFRLRDGEQTLSTEAKIRWCRLVRNETVDGESRPVYRAGAAFVELQPVEPAGPQAVFEEQVDDTLEQWVGQRETAPQEGGSKRKIIRYTPRHGRRP